VTSVTLAILCLTVRQNRSIVSGVTALAEPLAPELGVTERALAATLSCIARHGLGKTTSDDVAREAGCSRATLYRYFGDKQQLVVAAFRTEAERVTERVLGAAAECDSLEDTVVTVLATAADELRDHPALSFVAAFEPERLLPHLTFSGGDRFLARASAALAPALERFVGPDAQRAAEWVVRIGLTLWLCPAGPVSMNDRDQLRAYVRAFVLPALEPSISTLSRG
jgi:AcrR family transcriptional regulator